MKNKVLTILLSVFVAFGLWLYVVTVEHTQIELTFYNIPVNWEGEDAMNDRDLRLVDRNLTISMKLYGNRSVLNKLKSSDIIVLADLNHITEAGEKKLNYEVSFSGVQSETIEIVDRPSSIDVQVAQWMDKTIPVVVKTSGTLGTPLQNQAPGVTYAVDEKNITTTVKEMDISGPIEVVSKIAQAKVTVDMDKKTGDTQVQSSVVLCDNSGNPVGDVSAVYVSNGGSTQVTVPVVAQKTVSLALNLDYSATPLLPEDVKYTINGEDVFQITIKGDLDAVVAAPDQINLATVVLANEPQGFQGRKYQIVLPEGLRCDEFTEVLVSMQVTEWTTKTMDLGQARISWDNAPAGYESRFRPEEITIAYRVADQFAGSDMRVTVIFDQANVASGRFSYTVTVVKGGREIPVYIVGDATIKVELTPKIGA